MSVSSMIVAALALLVLFWAVGAYQRLTRQRRHCRATMEPLPGLLAARHRQVAPLVEAARPVLAAEGHLLEDALASGNAAQAAAARLPRALLDPAVAAPVGQAEQALDRALAAVAAAVRGQAHAGVPAELQQMLHELDRIQDEIAVARTVYNHAAAVYNASRSQFPSIVVAVIFAFRPVAYLRAAAAANGQTS